jgi:hypothetical protein
MFNLINLVWDVALLAGALVWAFRQGSDDWLEWAAWAVTAVMFGELVSDLCVWTLGVSLTASRLIEFVVSLLVLSTALGLRGVRPGKLVLVVLALAGAEAGLFLFFAGIKAVAAMP